MIGNLKNTEKDKGRQLSMGGGTQTVRRNRGLKSMPCSKGVREYYTVQQCQINAQEEIKITPDFRNHRATGGQDSGTRGDVGKTPGITGKQSLDSGT